MPTRAPRRGPSPLPPVAEATRAATVVLGAAAVAFAAAYAALPRHREWMASSNGLVDLSTAVLLALTFLVGIWALRRTPGADRWHRLLPAAAMLGLLDEIHFGASLFGFGMPRVGPVTVDGLSALFAVGQHIGETQLGLSPLDLAAAAAVVAACGAFLMARRRRAARAAAWLADRPPAAHLLVSVTLVTAAVACDVFAGSGPMVFVEEWLEFVAGAFLLRGTLLIPRHKNEALGWRQRLRPWLDDNTPQRAMPSAGPRRPNG
jgi:hypothetical protein